MMNSVIDKDWLTYVVHDLVGIGIITPSTGVCDECHLPRFPHVVGRCALQ